MFNFDFKCSVTNAIITVLIYLLFIKLVGANGNKSLQVSTNWYESMEVLLLVSALIGFNINVLLFGSCSTNTTWATMLKPVSNFIDNPALTIKAAL
jgi:hypothetical protein